MPAPQIFTSGTGCTPAREQLQRADTFFAAQPGSVGNVYAGGMPFIPPRGPIGGALLLSALAAQSVSAPDAADYAGRRRADTRDDQPSLLRSVGGDLLLEAELLATTQAAAEVMLACDDAAEAAPLARRIAERASARAAQLDQGVALVAPAQPMRLMPGSELRGLAETLRRRRAEALETLARLERAGRPVGMAAVAE
ncbi:hypothetical protein [Falsiroseomonas sp. HW251]|uniref:hypothetical protein n=1 Tax=Falsiroseomonas sp. HW251 TaxID=3390998 RepID=UPI003D31DBAC